MNLPPIVTREAWLEARNALLEEEKAFTRAKDRLNALRRQLPMVEVTADYTFEGPDGRVELGELFEGRAQLIVYHFMFDPSWDQGCPGCTFLVDNIGKLDRLHEGNTSLALVSRAPLEKLERYREERGWSLPWYSSYGSEFNYDFHVTIDHSRGPQQYNYRPARDPSDDWDGSSIELPGHSVFLRDGDRIFHTYSTYQRGADLLLTAYNYLDLTPLGRQEPFEEEWNRRAAAGELSRRDRVGAPHGASGRIRE